MMHRVGRALTDGQLVLEALMKLSHDGEQFPGFCGFLGECGPSLRQPFPGRVGALVMSGFRLKPHPLLSDELSSLNQCWEGD